MTIRRTAEQTFLVEKMRVTNEIQAILAGEGKYRKTAYDSAKSTFTTTVWPVFFVLPTEMTIALTEAGTDTLVTVSVRSQPFVSGDVFNGYGYYIRQFLSKLERSVGAEYAGPIRYIEDAAFVDGRLNWSTLVLVGGLLLFLVVTALWRDSMIGSIWLTIMLFAGVLLVGALTSFVMDYRRRK